MIDLSYEDLLQRAGRLVNALPKGKDLRVYGVPRGGVYAALLLLSHRPSLVLAEAPETADYLVDDIIDSGATCGRYGDKYHKPFLALVDKQGPDAGWAKEWITFPWERAEGHRGPEDAVVRLLEFIGEDPAREGLRETPARVLKSYGEIFAGYKQDPVSVFKCFADGACDEMVVLKDVEFFSNCEHHMLPFFGKAHIAYVPRGKIVGISKLARLLEIYSRRLQVQERLTVQVTAALDKHLNPLGSACVVEATHACMTCRGVNKQNSRMITSSLTGVFRSKPEARTEFFNLIRG